MNYKPLTLVIIALLTVSSFNSLIVSAFAAPPELRRVIIGFHAHPSDDLILRYGGKIKYRYQSIPAIACWLPPQAIEALKHNPQIAYIEDDVVVSLVGRLTKPPNPNKPAKKGFLVTCAYVDGIEASVPYEVDGVSMGTTTDTLRLAPATYVVTATYYGITHEQTATVLAGQTTLVTFYFTSPQPSPQTGFLTVDAKLDNDIPVAAYVEVYLGDELHCQNMTPFTVELAPTTYSLTAVFDNHTQHRTTDVVANQTTWESFVFPAPSEPPPPTQGTLQITTTPILDGEIFINGVSQGLAPVTTDVVVGSYTISFGDVSGYVTPVPQTAVVQENQTTSVVGVYQPLPPPDPELPWGVDRIDAELAWSTSNGTNVQVAILDTGIDKDHPELQGNILAGINFVWSSFPFLWNPNAWDDDHGHGTWCAGIVGALKNNAGVVGVAPDVDLVAVKVLDASGSGQLSDIIAGIEWCMNNCIDVISMSFAGPDYSNAFHNICNAAYTQGIVLIAAAGNVGDGNPLTNEVQYPAKYESVIAVAAVDQQDVVASFSADGDDVEVAAPGVSIYSAWRGGGFKVGSGTSAACPHVAGTVALFIRLDITQPLFKAYDTNNDTRWDSWEVRKRLHDTADDLGAVGVDVFYGYGLVDAQEAVTGVQTTP